MTVAGLGDASALHSIPAGVFARHQTAVTHQVAAGSGNAIASQVRRRSWPPSFAPPRAEPAALRSPPGSPAAPAAPPRQWPSPVSRSGPPRDPLPPGNRPASPPAPACSKWTWLLIHSRCFLVQAFDSIRPAAVPQQELAQPVPRLQLILLGRFARPHQIAQRFVRGVRHPHGRQLPGAVAARQFLRIAAVGLHPISGLGRNQAGRDHFTGNSQLRELPVEHVPGRSSFIAGLQMPAPVPACEPVCESIPTGSGSRPCERTSPPVSATATAIVSAWTSRPTKRTLDIERPTPFVCGSAPLDSPLRSVTRAYCDSAVGRSILTSPSGGAPGRTTPWSAPHAPCVLVSYCREILTSGSVGSLAAALVCAICLLIAFWKIALTAQYTFIERPDIGHQVLPWLQVQASALRSGELPLWDPYLLGGQTLVGQVQPAVFSPITWLLLRRTPGCVGAVEARPGCHMWFVLLHGWVPVFAYLFIRSIGAGRMGSVVGAVFFATTGFLGSRRLAADRARAQSGCRWSFSFTCVASAAWSATWAQCAPARSCAPVHP